MSDEPRKPNEPMKNYVIVKTRIEEVADADANYRSMANVSVTPSKDGHVFLSATEGHTAAVVESQGIVEKEEFLPQAAFGERKERVLIEMSIGQWKATTDNKLGAGLFGKRESALPRVARLIANSLPRSIHNRIAVSIRPSQMQKLANAISTKGILTLYIVPDNKAAAYAVVGDVGIGVAMPANSNPPEVDYDELRGRFFSAQEKLNPTPPPPPDIEADYREAATASREVAVAFTAAAEKVADGADEPEALDIVEQKLKDHVAIIKRLYEKLSTMKQDEQEVCKVADTDTDG